MGLIYTSVPFGSVSTLPEDKLEGYIKLISKLPDKTRAMIYALETGASLRGLAKSYELPEEKAIIMALAVVRVAVGELSFGQLPGALSANLPLPNDKAQRMAREIEQDLFGPVRAELEEFWARQRKEEPGRQAQERATEGGARNVLNLKTERRVPLPPPMPGRGRDQ